ncbi:MAG TPA: sulfurtransferase TusA family protein [Caulobacteraceae bacterium]|nr:sulfurtransferase TusA family protein [Caulobacteraceae bacterium]
MDSDRPILVDARGHRCPAPTLRLARALRGAGAGQAVRLLADDPMARIDVPHYAAHNGLTVLAVTDEGSWMSFLVVRKGQA